MVQIFNYLFGAGLDPEVVLHAEEAILPANGICPVISGKINFFLMDEYCTDHATSLSMKRVSLPTRIYAHLLRSS